MDYDSIKALNFSSLKHLAKSPLEYRYRIDHPEPRKQAWVIGGAIHTAALEPDKLDSRYAIFDGTRRGKAWDNWQDLHPGIESLKPVEMTRVKKVAAAIHAHPVASKLLYGSRIEEPLVWTDPDTGLKCKGRVDAIGPAGVLDLKSARDVDPFRFARAAAEYMYHGQLSFYQIGAIASRKIIPRPAVSHVSACIECGEPSCDHDTARVDIETAYEMPYIIAAQSGGPYDVAVYRMKPEDLDAGRSLCLSLMRKLEECIASDMWPGAVPDLQYLDLPPWAPGAGGLDEEGF